MQSSVKRRCSYNTINNSMGLYGIESNCAVLTLWRHWKRQLLRISTLCYFYDMWKCSFNVRTNIRPLVYLFIITPLSLFCGVILVSKIWDSLHTRWLRHGGIDRICEFDRINCIKTPNNFKFVCLITINIVHRKLTERKLTALLSFEFAPDFENTRFVAVGIELNHKQLQNRLRF